MALKLNEKYPGYMNAPSVDYPQGSFKNRTSPTSEDGSYFEEAWANDDQGFKQSILSAAGVTANGQVDKVGASQYFDALKQVIRDESPAPSQATESIAGIAKVSTPVLLKTGVNNDSFATAKGLKDAGLWPIGVGQSWVDMTASRTTGVNYTNTTGRPIVVVVSSREARNPPSSITVDGVIVARQDGNSDTSNGSSDTVIVPSGSVYRFDAYATTTNLFFVVELR